MLSCAIVFNTFAGDNEDKSSLKTELREFDQDKNGTKEVNILTIRRDGKRILTEYSNQNDKTKNFKIYEVGKIKIIERNYDADGTVGTLFIYNIDNLDECELFIKKENKTVPVPTPDLKLLIKGMKESQVQMEETVKKCVDKVLSEVQTPEQTPSPEGVQRDKQLKNDLKK